MSTFSPPHIPKRPFSRINPHITPSYRRNSSNAAIIAGVIILLIVIVGILSLWKGDSTGDLILNVISLRKAPTDVVKRSTLISTTNEMISSLGNKRIKGDWDTLSECMQKGCTDIDYYNFLITVVTQKKVANGDLIYNLILVNKYWGTAEIIDFSQALTKVDKAVSDLGSREVTKAWQAIVACDGKCVEKDDLFFQMIKTIVMTE